MPATATASAHSAPATSTRPAWVGDIIGGATGAVLSLPSPLACGIILFQPLGPDYLAAGILAAFASSIVVGALAGLLGGGKVHLSQPKPALAAVHAGLIATLMDGPLASAGIGAEDAAPLLVGVTFLSVMLAGAIQIAIGAARFGNLVKFIPYPVAAGFINGLILLIVISQVPPLLGVGDAATIARLIAGDADPSAINPAAAALGLGTMVVVIAPLRLLPGKWTPPVSVAAMIGLVLGTVAHHAVASMAAGIDPGRVVGAIPGGFPLHLALGEAGAVLTTPALLPVAGTIASTAVTLAVLMSLQSLLSATDADARQGGRHDSNRELIAQGIANVAAGAAGGMAGSGSIPHTHLAYQAGARTRTAAVVNGAVLLVAIWFLAPLVAALPLAVVAAAVIVVNVAMVDDWSRQLVRRFSRRHDDPETRQQLNITMAIVVLVAVLLILAGTLTAVGIGMAVAFLVFLSSVSQRVVRRIYHADAVRSRITRPNRDMDLLSTNGRAIAVFELQGPVFFGSADELARQVDEEAAGGRLASLILDFKRVQDIDQTGVMILERIDRQLAARGILVTFSYLTDDSPLGRLMRIGGFDLPATEGRQLPDTDSALGSAEDRLLDNLRKTGRLDPDRLPALVGHDLTRGLSEAEVATVEAETREQQFEAGDRIITEGDSGSEIFFLTHGQVSVVKRIPGSGRVLRLASFQAGVSFGGMALLTGDPRSADVDADTDVVCSMLTREAFDRLTVKHPTIASCLLRNIAMELAAKLMATTNAMRELEN